MGCNWGVVLRPTERRSCRSTWCRELEPEADSRGQVTRWETADKEGHLGTNHGEIECHAEELHLILQRNKKPAGSLEEESDGTKSVF